MVFNLFLRLMRANTEVERLKWSVYYGWALLAIIVISFMIFGILGKVSTNDAEDPFALIFWVCLLLFSFRYTSTKPFLGAIAGGVTVISIAVIIDNLSSRRDSSSSLGAFVGVMLMLLFIILKNVVVGLYYLIKETIRYVKFKKSSDSTGLEETNLNVEIN